MNKQMLNISERDKKLLIMLIMVLIAFLCYYFILNPALTNGSSLKSQYENVQTEYDRVATLTDKLPELKKEEASQKKQLHEKYKQFFYEVNEARILYKLDSTMAEAGFPVDSVGFSRTSAAEVAVNTADFKPLTYPLYINASKVNPSLTIPETEEGAKVEQQGNKAVSLDAVAYTDVIIGFSASSYEGIYNFLKKLENLDRSIIVKNVEIEKNETAAITGQIVLGVYSLAKLNESDSLDLKFDNAFPKGKANPFL